MKEIVVPAVRPQIVSTAYRSEHQREPLDRLGFLSYEFHKLDFSESQYPSNSNWVSRSKTITPPRNWKQVTVFVAAWDFDFFPGERPVSHLGVEAGVRVVGGAVEIAAYAICRYNQADDSWQGQVTVGVIFIG